MKKILITGANSYIGMSFEKYLKDNFDSNYAVETIDMIDGSWRNKSFANYDTVYHVAGIAHSDNGKISPEKERLYRKINTDLTIEVATKAKKEGVKQFIFMSSAIVYGNSAPIGKQKIITKETQPSPANCYGDSKLKAECGIQALCDGNFKVCILRPPMIFGPKCKGNYPTLSKFAKKLKFFPYVNNQRSMLYIGNFVEFVRLVIDNEEQGIFWPQNKEYTNTSLLVREIAKTNGKKVFLIKGFGWALKILSHITGLINKAFGNLVYDQEMSEYKQDYRKYNLEDAIVLTENIKE